MATSTYTPGSNDIIHKIDLDLVSRSRVVEPIHMVQNDKVLPVLAMSLYKEGTSYSCPSGSTVSIRLEKPDKKVVNIEVSGWDNSRHVIYMKTTYQMTSAFGKATALLEIDTGSGIAQTETFPIMIDRNPVQDGSIESTDEIKSLQSYVDAAAASANQAQSYRDTAGTYANSARTSATEANSARSQASGYATNAELAKTTAQNSASAAEDASNLSKSYAVGTNNTVRPGDKTDNAKAYSELAARLTDQATALLEEAERLLEQVNPEGAINPDTPITFQQATELANIQNEDSIRIALGKLSKLYASLDGKAAFYPVTTSRDISAVGTLMDGKTVADWIKEVIDGGFTWRGYINNDSIESETFFTNLDFGEYELVGANTAYFPYSYGTLLHFKPRTYYGVMIVIDVEKGMAIRAYSLRNNSWYTDWQKYVRIGDLASQPYNKSDINPLLEDVNILEYTRIWKTNYMAYAHVIFSVENTINSWTEILELPFKTARETVACLVNTNIIEIYMPTNSKSVNSMTKSIPKGEYAFDIVIPIV